MHKFPIPIACENSPAKSRLSSLNKAGILLLGFSLAPLIAEGASICYAQWSQVIGRNATASTPVLDTLHEGITSGHRSFWSVISPCFDRVPWSHRAVLATGAVLMIVAIAMLKL